MKKQYSTDLTDSQWQGIKKLIKVQRQSIWDLQRIVEAILYWTKNGCIWRDLPSDFPVWQTVYWYYRKWIREGTFELISAELTILARLKADKSTCPSVVIVDSQSVKNSSTATQEVGFDGGKCIKGRKRFAIVDTLGSLLWGEVVAANAHDGMTASQFLQGARHLQPLLDEVEKIYADGTFGGTFKQLMGTQMGLEVEIPKIPIAKKGKVEIHEKRWIVERFFAWCGNNKRLAKDYERLTICSRNLLFLVNIRRLVRQI